MRNGLEDSPVVYITSKVPREAASSENNISTCGPWVDAGHAGSTHPGEGLGAKNGEGCGTLFRDIDVS